MLKWSQGQGSLSLLTISYYYCCCQKGNYKLISTYSSQAKLEIPLQLVLGATGQFVVSPKLVGGKLDQYEANSSSRKVTAINDCNTLKRSYSSSFSSLTTIYCCAIGKTCRNVKTNAQAQSCPVLIGK